MKFLLLLFIAVVVLVSESSCQCYSFKTRKAIHYRLGWNDEYLIKPIVNPSNEWNYQPLFTTTSASLHRPTSSFSTDRPTSTPSSNGSVTAMTTRPTVVFLRDNCSERETALRRCDHGYCYAVRVTDHVVEYDRVIECHCDELFTGERCETPKTDIEELLLEPLTDRVSAPVLVSGVTAAIVCIVLVVVVLVVYCASFAYSQCYRKAEDDDDANGTSNVRQNGSGDANAGPSSSIAKDNAVRRRRFFQSESIQVEDTVELKPLPSSSKNTPTQRTLHEESPGLYIDSVGFTLTERRELISTQPDSFSPTSIIVSSSSNNQDSNNSNNPVDSSPRIYTLV